MSISDLVYPDETAPARLLEELTGFFAQFPVINQILTFGSMARGGWDRWSDVDLLVVTHGGSGQQWRLFNRLRQYKPILHHHPFVLMEPSGGFIPGIAFEDESVFHLLDLNFISLSEFQSPGALERFSPMRNLFVSNVNNPESDECPPYKPIAENQDEKRIGMGLHWVKKAVKQVLRGSDNYDKLVKTSTHLKEIMADFPKDILTPGGNICQLARRYVEIADFLSGNQS
ncbi:MAG: nucleotidyltransferase domain-containing protein [Chloroflexi bacterium]|nr:nucleotidyltransferase domain-containing protein [Chloroflexota bacterium]